MAIYTVRRLAADILNVGENKIKIRPDDVQRVTEALTRVDVQNLIKDGVIFKAKFIGKRKQEKRKRRREASRRGAVRPTKEDWMSRVRSQRLFLRELLADALIDKKIKRTVYMKIKSGIFKSKRAMLAYLKDNSLLKGEPKPKERKIKEIKELEKPSKKVVKVQETKK